MIVEKNSFTEAAEELYISQSSLSQQMLQLEQNLGFALFHHHSRRVSLTEAGRSFYPRAQQIVQLIHTAVGEGKTIERLSLDHRRGIRIGCVGDQFLHVWIDRLRVSEPISSRFAPIACRYDSYEKLHAAMLKQEIDIAVEYTADPTLSESFTVIPFSYIREWCVPIPGMTDSVLSTQTEIEPEALFSHTVAFHNPAGYNDYEDRLRKYFLSQYREKRILNPVDFLRADFEKTVLLVPEIQCPNYRNHAPLVLRWEKGSTLNFVLPKNHALEIRSFADYLLTHIDASLCPWYIPLDRSDTLSD